MNTKQIHRRIRHAAACALVATALLTPGLAPAQDFETTFGRTLAENANTIAQLANGDIATAGYSRDAVTGTGGLYVVRTNSAGIALWERRYVLGSLTMSFTGDIKESASGDLLLVGNVTDPGGAPCPTCTHVCVLRISANGDLEWYRVFGEMNSNQYGISLVEGSVAINGDPRYVGDIIIAGYAEFLNYSMGFLARIDEDGTLLWANYYDVDRFNINGNQLLAVEEAMFTNAGDIVATGTVQMPNVANQVWGLRVSGVDGTINLPPQNSAVYGTEAVDRGYSIRELRLGQGASNYNGDLVIAGETWGRPGTSNSEILTLRVGSDPCNAVLADHFLGDAGANRDYGRSMREISDAQLGNVGDLVVTGATDQMRGRTLARDVFLQQFTPSTMGPVGAFHTYGGDLTDVGASVDIIRSGIVNPGFLVGGYTNSIPPMQAGNDVDMYVIRTDAQMRTCSEVTVQASPQKASLGAECRTWSTDVTDPKWTVRCGFGGGPMDWGVDNCLVP